MATIAAGQVEKVLGSNTFQWAVLAGGAGVVYLFWDELSALWSIGESLDPLIDPTINAISDTAEFMAGGAFNTESKAISLLIDPDPIAQIQFISDLKDSDNIIESSIADVSIALADLTTGGNLADTIETIDRMNEYTTELEETYPLTARYLKKYPLAFREKFMVMDTMNAARDKGVPYSVAVTGFLNAYPTSFPPLSVRFHTAAELQWDGGDGAIYFNIMAPDDAGVPVSYTHLTLPTICSV